MGKIFYVMGKSASGKDTIYHNLLKRFPELKKVILYTTRPPRDGEIDGITYYFTTERQKEEMKLKGQIIEEREYHTVYGIWYYFTADKGQFKLERQNYIMIGTLESYEKMKDYFGEEVMVPIYIFVEDGTRLQRALEREKSKRNQSTRSYAEGIWQMKKILILLI